MARQVYIRDYTELKKGLEELDAPSGGNREGPLVSIIIPTHNSARTLSRVFDSLATQNYPNFEVVVVDRLSIDQTAVVARANGAQVVLLSGERSQAKNCGARLARGSLLYFIDSDYVLEPGVVEEAVRIVGTGLDAVVVPNRSDPSGGFWPRVRSLERDCYVDDDVNVAARFVGREAFFLVGGFDERLYSAEDYDLHLRLLGAGMSVGRITSSEWHIGEPKSLAEIARKARYYGANAPEFLSKHPKHGLALLGPVRRAYLRHWKQLCSHPFLLSGILLENVVKYFYAILGFLSASRGKPNEARSHLHQKQPLQRERDP